MDKALLDELSQVLDENDPCGIIDVCTRNGFAYEDIAGEYRNEAETILLRQREWSDPWELQIAVKEIFDRSFHYPNISEDQYLLIARDIWNAVLVHQGKEPEVYVDEVEPQQGMDFTVIELE